VTLVHDRCPLAASRAPNLEFKTRETTVVPLSFLAAAAAATAETAEKSGLPQLNPESYPSQLIWLAITFGFLYFALSSYILPRIGAAIEERRERIQSDIDQAEQLKAETDKAIADYEQALATARSDASRIARETREKLAAETEQERSAVEAQVAEKIKEAEQRINAVKATALAQVGDIASETAGDIVGKLIGGTASPDEVKAALSSSQSS
jgi:F-type H+-transporting ATPase subunit b